MEDDLLSPIVNGDLWTLKIRLDRGINVNSRDKLNRTALIYAARYCTLDIVKELLNRGADPNLQDRDGKTALMAAVRCPDQVEIVRELLDHGADPNIKDNHGLTAINLANEEPIIENYKEVIDLLMNEFDPEIIDPNTGVSNFLILAANGPLNQLRLIIDQDPDLDLNQQDRDGNTALIYAIVNRKPEHVSLLLDRGADPNLANFGGATPLAYAVQLDDPTIEQILLDAGVQ
jgi:ankyrin repeat protein